MRVTAAMHRQRKTIIRLFSPGRLRFVSEPVINLIICVLLISLPIGCSTQTKSYLKALQQKNGFIASAPTDIEPIILRPVIHGLHAVGAGEVPRLGNKIGAAATPGIELTIDRTAGFDIGEEGFKVYTPNGYTDNK
ncbi:hypothetical protein IH992_28655, partial [Candidatus Poribacteria bacterium]|nr:hypothetical protein [Candidatus Poribacteria bacterium]